MIPVEAAGPNSKDNVISDVIGNNEFYIPKVDIGQSKPLK